MEVTQVKMTKAGTTIQIEAPNEAKGGSSTPEARSLINCPDKSKELAGAFEALHTEACRMLGFTRKDEKARVRVMGVSVSRDKSRNRSFIIHTIFRSNVGESTLLIPRVVEKVEGLDAQTAVLSDTGLKQVEKVLAAGLAYYQGERAQTELALEEDQKEAAEG